MYPGEWGRRVMTQVASSYCRNGRNQKMRGARHVPRPSPKSLRAFSTCRVPQQMDEARDGEE